MCLKILFEVLQLLVLLHVLRKNIKKVTKDDQIIRLDVPLIVVSKLKLVRDV